jgi:hypothetical protein
MTEKRISGTSPLSRVRRQRGIRGRIGFLVLLTASFLPSVARAQLYVGSLTGVVTDPSGSVVPRATITLTDVAKGLNYKAATDSAGRYLLRLLPPANYELTVQAPGFRTAVRSGIVLDVNQNATIDVTLQIITTKQAVEVKATAPLLSTQDATTGQEVNRAFMNDLPLIGRGALDLEMLAPGVNPSAGWAYGSLNSPLIQTNFVSNGGRNMTADVLVDGVSATSPEGHPGIQTPLYVPSIDDVQEFKVEQNNFSADKGFSANTLINVVTRSGTNHFHGSAYEFFQNQDLAAASWFTDAYGETKSPYVYNDFGGTLGGPIQKDKTFFFVDYEGNRSHGPAGPFLTGVPSALERTGDFGELCGYAGGTFDSSGMCSGADGQIWDPYSGVYSASAGGAVRSTFIPFNNMATYQSPGNPNLNGTGMQLAAQPGNLIDPVASKMMSYYPLPNYNLNNASYSQYANWTGNSNYTSTMNQFDTRIDRRFGDRDTLSARFSFDDLLSGGAICYNNFMDPCSFGPDPVDQRAFALNEVHTFSPNTVLTAALGFARQFEYRKGAAANFPGVNIVSTLGFPSYMGDSGVRAAPMTVVGSGYYSQGATSIGSTNSQILYYAIQTYHAMAALDHMRGHHEFKFGGEMRIHQDNETQPGYPGGNFTFLYNSTSQGPNYGGGDAMAGLLTGTSTTGSGVYSISPYTSTQNFDWAGYFQDNYRASNKLTLNLGLRYELIIPRTERYNRQAYFDPHMPSPMGPVTIFGVTQTLPGGLVYDGPGHRHNIDTNYRGIAPRFGLAYRLTPKMVLRAGYGIYYNPSQFAAAAASGASGGMDGYSANSTMIETYQSNGATPWGRLSNPYPNGLVFPTGNTLGAKTNIGTGIAEYIPYENAMPYTQTWSAGFQYALPGNMVITANYVGTKGTHLYATGWQNINHNGIAEESLPATTLAAMVPNPFYGIVTNPAYPYSAPKIAQVHLYDTWPQYQYVNAQYPPVSNSIYHAFQLSVEKRFSSGLQLLVNYTNSKNIDNADVSVGTTWDGGIGSEADPNDFQNERSVAGFDIPQVLNIAYIYQLPFGSGKHWGGSWNRWVNGFLGGWQTNGMWRFDDGQPIHLSESGGISLPGYTQRPNLVGQLHINPRSKWFCSGTGCGYFSNQGSTTAQATDVAVVAPKYAIGTAPRYLPNVRAPGTSTGALSLFKEIPLNKLREGSRLEFRVEAFNALNHPQFSAPNTVVHGGSFGIISGQANSSREVQLGLKMYF